MLDGGSEQVSPRSLRGASSRLAASLLGLARTHIRLIFECFFLEWGRIAITIRANAQTVAPVG